MTNSSPNEHCSRKTPHQVFRIHHLSQGVLEIPYKVGPSQLHSIGEKTEVSEVTQLAQFHCVCTAVWLESESVYPGTQALDQLSPTLLVLLTILSPFLQNTWRYDLSLN